jgi:6-phosphofructokinase 1
MVGYSFTVGMVNGWHTYIPFYVSNKLLFYRVKCFSCTLLKFPGTTYLASSVLTSSAGSSFDGRGYFHQEQGYNQPSLLSHDIDEASEANMLSNRPPQLPLDQILKCNLHIL